MIYVPDAGHSAPAIIGRIFGIKMHRQSNGGFRDALTAIIPTLFSNVLVKLACFKYMASFFSVDMWFLIIINLIGNNLQKGQTLFIVVLYEAYEY